MDAKKKDAGPAEALPANATENKPDSPQPGKCQVCGGTDPAKWADQTETICTGCADTYMGRAAEARKAKKTRASDTNPETKESDMGTKAKSKKAKIEKKPKAAKTPKAPKPKKEPKPKVERKKLGEVALVMRVSKEALAYIDANAGDRPRTAWLRDVLGKGDAKLGKILEPA